MAADEDANGNEGFGLVEVVVAMFLLAMVAVALMPALIQGIRYASAESTVATATRHLNGLVEEARANPSCTALDAVVAPATFTDGRGATLTSKARSGTYDCDASPLVKLDLVVTDASGLEIAGVIALVYVP